jgi:hypothetical protein
LDDKTTRFVSSRIHNFSHLESIEIYTVRENVNLVDVLKAMEGSSEKLPDGKDNASLKAYFTKVYPDLDFDRVYSSDLKKMVKWFSVLKNNDVEIKLAEPAEEAAGEEEASAEKKAPAKKAVKKEEDEKPKKEKAAAEKPAAKEKAEKASAAPAKKAAKKEEAEEKAPAKKVAKKEEAPKKKVAKEEEEKPKKAAPKKAAKKK